MATISASLSLFEPGFSGGDDVSSQACSRCGGLTVPEWMREEMIVSPARRCIICGDIVDPVILRNRGGSLSL
jgi:hypothetical protein